jgi:hypothetical protein
MLNSSILLDAHCCLETIGDTKVAYLQSAEPLLRTPRDFLDFMGWAGEQGTNLLLVTDTSFEPAFYDLSTGLAGEIFQKVSNYRQRIAIIGSFDMVTSRRFREFMTECNKGRSIGFLPNEAAAFNWLAAEQL